MAVFSRVRLGVSPEVNALATLFLATVFGLVALAGWLVQVRAVATDIHALSIDATAPKGQRRQARAYLRAQNCRRFQLLNALLAAIEPAVPPAVERQDDTAAVYAS